MLIALLTVLILIQNSLDQFCKRRKAEAASESVIGQFLDTATILKTIQIASGDKEIVLNDIMNNFVLQSASAAASEAVSSSSSSSSDASATNSGGGGAEAAADKSCVVIFKSGDKQCCHETGGRNVKVVCSAGSHDHGSSKVKLKNIVDYKWEMKNYPGHLIAVHIDGKHIAYVINVNSKLSRMEGMIRVVNVQSGLRALIKGMSGEVLDLQFAHIEKDRILASIDQNSLYVHKIDMKDDNLYCNLIMKFEDPLKNYTPKYDRISWCPYVECPIDDDDDSSQLIVWARGSVYQCFNIGVIVMENGIGKTYHSYDVNSGYLRFYDSAVTITWAALSPDGTTLGVGSIDGIIRFYQVYFHEKEPRCLHQWKPHNGKPVSSFFFLDNLTQNSAETYWKHAITGAINNTEFRVWDCGTWACLQSLKMSSVVEEKHLRFIVEMDRTSSYMVISSLDTRTCYVLQIVNNSSSNSNNVEPGSSVLQDSSAGIIGDTESNTPKDTNSSCSSSGGIVSTMPKNQRRRAGRARVFIKSISEFPLSSGILSFSIVDAAVRRYKCSNDNYLCEEYDDYDEETNSLYCVVVRMFIVQSKSMQECHILYQPTVCESADVRSTISNDSAKDSSLLGCVAESGAILPKTNKSNISFLHGGHHLDGRGDGMDDDDDADEDDVGGVVDAAADADVIVESEETGINTQQEMKQEKVEGNALEVLLGIAATSVANPLTVHTNSTASSSALATTAAAANAPSSANAIIKGEPKNDSPKANTSVGYSQVNLMTPDAFNASNELDSAKSASSTNWHNVTDAHKVTTKHSAELQNAANLISQAVCASNAVNMSNSHVAPSLVNNNNSGSGVIGSSCNNISANIMNSNNNNNINSNGAVHADLVDLNKKMNQLLELVKVQSMQINNLQCELIDMKKSNPLSTPKGLAEFSFKLEMQLSKLMEQYLKRYELEHNKKLSAFMAGRDVQNREMRDNFLQIINQFMLSQLGEVFSKVLTIEMQRQLMPMLAAKIDSMQNQIQIDVAQKLGAFDLIIRENIAQVCKSKNIIETFGKSVLVGVQGSLQAAFIESMSSTLIPAYEKSSQNMFKQLHEAFTVGIKEFMEQFDNYLQHLQPMQDSTQEIINKFSSLKQHLDGILVKHRTTMSETMLETRKEFKSLEILLSRQIQETIRSEVRKCFETQAVILRSQANTPAPIYDLKDTIKHLLQQGQINKAFHQALLANDLNLVEFTLKNTDHNAVFTPDCCLEQKVLLSLIQQISADMSNHNELKQNYLAEALLAINTMDPITREHAPKVLQELFRNCQMFLINHPKSAQCSNVRMLMKAVHSYKDQF